MGEPSIGSSEGYGNWMRIIVNDNGMILMRSGCSRF